jgi:uroporphyrin-III C-methyltransferase/precorrin-2 dehydrogenase/sirohydrochlorin ferrochelatase
MREGLDPQTPAIAVANATRPEETVIASTVKDLAAALAARHWSGPLVILVGAAFGSAAARRADKGQPVSLATHAEAFP